MTIEKKMELLADALDLEVGEFTAETELETLDMDSVTILSIIAMLDESFDKQVKGSAIKELKTVQDILDIMEE